MCEKAGSTNLFGSLKNQRDIKNDEVRQREMHGRYKIWGDPIKKERHRQKIPQDNWCLHGNLEPI